MNERIRELKNKVLDEHFSHTWTTMDYQDVEKFAEKLAELLITECVDTLEFHGFKDAATYVKSAITNSTKNK